MALTLLGRLMTNFRDKYLRLVLKSVFVVIHFSTLSIFTLGKTTSAEHYNTMDAVRAKVYTKKEYRKDNHCWVYH